MAVRTRVPKDPTPRFKEADAEALKVADACVPADHLARKLTKLIEKMDVSALESRYSALGQHGYRPRWLLGVWLYASLRSVHHTTKVEQALQTDMAYRLLSGGHVISRPVLNRFRQHGGDFFAAALQLTVRWAFENGMIDANAVAVDSMRLKAHGGRHAVRTLKHSEEKLKELRKKDVSKLSAAEKLEHEAAVERNESVVKHCEEKGVKTFLTTNPLAALIQFPGNGFYPGHRLTVASCGASSRIALGILVSAAPNDIGQLGPIVQRARRALTEAGLPNDVTVQAAADKGYFTRVDLAFARDHREWLDVLIPEMPDMGPLQGKNKDFVSRSEFKLNSRDDVLCPSGAPMERTGFNSRDEADVYKGVGCDGCALKRRCTTAGRRTFTVNWQYEEDRSSMRARMATQGAAERYSKRIATIEPVFSSLEDVMGFRRASSRFAQTIHAEVLLKLLAHNVSRLLSGKGFSCVIFLFAPDEWLLSQNLRSTAVF
jgi:transposase